MKIFKVLIIDENVARLEALKVFFKGLGHQTFTNPCWQNHTIQDIINISPGVIVLGESFSGIKEYDIGTILKSINQLRKVPLISASEAADFADVVKKTSEDQLFRLN